VTKSTFHGGLSVKIIKISIISILVSFFISQKVFTIDLAWKQWTQQFGTSTGDYGYAITVDSSNNVFVTGTTYGELDGNTNLGQSDAYVIKYSSSGNRIWTRQAGSVLNDIVTDIVSDNMGNIYITGYTYGGFDGNTYLGGDTDAFLAKYDSSGTKQWTKQIGTSALDYSNGIVCDTNGNIYITGFTAGTIDGNVNPGGNDIFFAKFDTFGNKQWIKQFGTLKNDVAYDIAIDTMDNVYITGFTNSELDGNANIGNNDIFLVKYDSLGNKQWTKQFGTSTVDEGKKIVIDKYNNIYISGFTYGGFGGNSIGNNDNYLVKCDLQGNIQWIRQFGTIEYEGEETGISLDNQGNIYVTGSTPGGLDGNVCIGLSDIYLICYDSSGTKQWTKQFGTSNDDFGYNIATDKLGTTIYVTGATSGGLDGKTNIGSRDAFLIQYKIESNISPSVSWSGESNYISDGLNPEISETSTHFTYQVQYTDADNDAPKAGYPKVHILRDNIEIINSPFTMNFVTGTYTTGAIYTFNTILTTGTYYTYYFEAYDVWDASATGSPTTVQQGPYVYDVDHYEILVPSTPAVTGAVFTITINAKNIGNQTLPGVNTTVALQPVIASNESQSGSGVLGVTQATLVNGTVTIANQTYTKAENIKLKVTDVDGKTGVSNQLTVTASNYGAYMTLSANPQSVITGQTVTLTIDARDYYGNAVVNIPLMFEVVKGTGVYVSTLTYTDTTGRGTTTFVPSLSGTGECVLRVTSPGLTSVEVRLYVSVLIVAKDGGVVIASDDPKTQLYIPPWLLKTDSEVKITRDTTTVASGEGQEVEVKAKERSTGNDITDLDGTVKLTLGYQIDSNGKVTNTNVAEADAVSALALYYHDGVQWQKLDGSTVDTANKTVTAKTSHLSRYALRGNATARSTSFRFTGIGPNPFSPNPDGINDRIYFYFENPANEKVDIKIYDLDNSLVRSIEPDSETVPYWNGRNNNGSLVEGGMYFYSLRVGSQVANGTIVLGK